MSPIMQHKDVLPPVSNFMQSSSDRRVTLQLPQRNKSKSLDQGCSLLQQPLLQQNQQQLQLQQNLGIEADKTRPRALSINIPVTSNFLQSNINMDISGAYGSSFDGQHGLHFSTGVNCTFTGTLPLATLPQTLVALPSQNYHSQHKTATAPNMAAQDQHTAQYSHLNPIPQIPTTVLQACDNTDNGKVNSNSTLTDISHARVTPPQARPAGKTTAAKGTRRRDVAKPAAAAAAAAARGNKKTSRNAASATNRKAARRATDPPTDEFIQLGISSSLAVPAADSASDGSSFEMMSLDEPVPSPSASPVGAGKADDLDFKNNDEEFTRWARVHPLNWERADVLNWLYCVAYTEQMDITNLRGEAFNSLTGQQLCMMTDQEFIEKDPQHGHKFHQELQQVIAKSKYQAPQFTDDHNMPFPFELLNTDATCGSRLNDGVFSSVFPLCATPSPRPPLGSSGERSPASVLLLGHTYDFDNTDTFPECPDEGYDSGDSEHENKHLLFQPQPPCTHPSYLLPYTQATAPTNNIYPITTSSQSAMTAASQEAGGMYACMKDIKHEPQIKQEQNMFTGYTNSCTQQTASYMMAPPGGHNGVNSSAMPRSAPKRSRGRPCKTDRLNGVCDVAKVKKQGHSKGNHLWEFILDLLNNPKYCPSYIKWENQQDGVFKFVISDQVAKLWGKKKGNNNMTYEKLSRAMRFCRDNNYFASLPKDQGYPKKLCFKFGPRAHGWQAS